MSTTDGSPLLRTILVEDEPLARKKLRSMLERLDGVEVVGECATGAEAIGLIPSMRPDLVFLDINLPELDGFAVLERLPAPYPTVVFVTAYDEFAVRAFEANAMDYLLKPFEEARLVAAVERVRERLSLAESARLSSRLSALAEALGDRRTTRQRFLVKSGNHFTYINADEIDWVESAQNYVKLHVGERIYMVRETVDNMESRLDPDRFLRIRKSTIINTHRVKTIAPWSATEYEVTLVTGQKLLSARTYRHGIRSQMLK